MSSHAKVVIARKPAFCSNDFAHDRKINPGDRIRVVTIYPGQDVVYVTVPTRFRQCSRCLIEREERES